MILAEFQAADPLMAAMLLETCRGRHALAAVLLDAIAKVAAEQATRAERERCCAHLKLGQLSNMDLAISAVRSGISFAEMSDRYVQAANEREQARKLRLVHPQAEGNDKGDAAC